MWENECIMQMWHEFYCVFLLHKSVHRKSKTIPFAYQIEREGGGLIGGRTYDTIKLADDMPKSVPRAHATMRLMFGGANLPRYEVSDDQDEEWGNLAAIWAEGVGGSREGPVDMVEVDDDAVAAEAEEAVPFHAEN